MTYSFLGPDPVENQVRGVLARLAAGEAPADIERAQVDVKEEPGRRGPGGVIQPGSSENGEAARYLAGEMACLANTPGGGAIILGIADKGEHVGTELEPDWLRHRIWELTDHKLTVDVREAELDGTRILVLSTHEAIEPVSHQGKIRWRVDDNCVEVDPTTWHTGKLQRSGVDWSAQPSGHVLADANPVALELARRYLTAAGDPAADALAEASDEDLLRRLNLATGEGRLTNAGSLLFVATPTVGIDYIRRDHPGGDSTSRLEGTGPLLEQVWAVDQASQAANRVVHVPKGLAMGQIRVIPARALREAIVNGVVHRDWLSHQATTVEHVGDVLTVTSPGGFIGGIDPSNIITHPAVPRYRSLAEAMAALRLAEREGVGVDRMVGDMLAIGRPGPEITAVAGPYIRVSLVGGDPDTEVIDFLSALVPPGTAGDLDALLLVEVLCRNGWVDIHAAAPILQRPDGETAASIERLARAHIGDDPVIEPVKGVPPDQPRAYRLSDAARVRLAHRIEHLTTPEGRKAAILAWASNRGRVSSTEAADLADLSQPWAGNVLTTMAEDGLLEQGRDYKAGRGFYYVPARSS